MALARHRVDRSVPREGTESMGRRLYLILGVLVAVSAPGPIARAQDRVDPALDLDLQRAQDSTPAKARPKARGGSPVSPGGKAGLNPAVGDEVVPPAPTPATGADLESSSLALDRIPLGKQSLGVTVDVQAPASMNLNREGNLKLMVRNTGSSDVFNVTVCDELPEGLQYISSQPEAHVVRDSLLTWRISNLPAGSDRPISIRVKPTRPGPFEHAARVTFLTGSKARSKVLEPRLKVDLTSNPTAGKVLKGQSVEFGASVTNTGDGVARDVSIQAKLSTGLRHERGDEQTMYELVLPQLGPNQTEKLDPLVADAVLGGEQTCTVTARSPDVVFTREEAEAVRTVKVVEPKLKLALKGPETRYTDTIADYVMTVENPGDAPARKVRILATLPISGRLVKVSPEPARYDKTTRRLQWIVDQLESESKPRSFGFQVRMGGIGHYEVLAEASGDGGLKAEDIRHTEVVGMADVDLVVSESKRVLDVGDKTTFHIRLNNYGTKDATNLLVSGQVSKNLRIVDAGGGSAEILVQVSQDRDKVIFSAIKKLAANKQLDLGILVEVTGDEPRQGTCIVQFTHADQPEPLQDMAAVKIPVSRRERASSQ
jgi:uncharacterized repeat protein (TIGR01451 family)